MCLFRSVRIMFLKCSTQSCPKSGSRIPSGKLSPMHFAGRKPCVTLVIQVWWAIKLAMSKFGWKIWNQTWPAGIEDTIVPPAQNPAFCQTWEDVNERNELNERKRWKNIPWSWHASLFGRGEDGKDTKETPAPKWVTFCGAFHEVPSRCGCEVNLLDATLVVLAPRVQGSDFCKFQRGGM